MSVNLGAPEYAALAFLCTGGLITASLEPLGKLRDVVLLRCSAAHRTYALLDNFNFLQETLERQRHWSYQMVKAPPGVKIRFERLVYKLDALDIPRPPITESNQTWHLRVASFIAAIQAREYEAALKLWEKHEQENVTR